MNYEPDAGLGDIRWHKSYNYKIDYIIRLCNNVINKNYL